LFAEAWNDWHKYWIEKAEKGDIPVYFFRFEDVLVDKKAEMEKLMKFVVGMEGSIEGTVLEARVAEMCAQGAKKNQVYKPGTGAANEKMFNYTESMIEYQKDTLEEMVHVFGYVEKNTEFFTYKDSKSRKNLNYYQKLNEKAWVARMNRSPNAKKLLLNTPKQPHRVDMISHFRIFQTSDLLQKISFD